MNIVVLDGHALNPGDLSWDGLRELGLVTVHDRTPEAQIVERAEGADVILTNKTPLSAATLQQLPDLRYIGVMATGYNIVDVDAAKRRGVMITNVPDYGTWSVAQHTIALLLELCNHVQLHDSAVQAGEWQEAPDWCFTRSALTELYGKTMGIVGHGRIGRQVGRIAAALGMQVLCVKRGSSSVEPLYGEKYAELAEVLRQSDVVSLHCPLTGETEHLINAASIAMMKPGALLLNTSRGGLLQEQDVAAALREGRLGGAGLDVVSQEPPRDGNPLIGAPNCVVTPHNAWATMEARSRMLAICIDNIRAYMEGHPVHVI